MTARLRTHTGTSDAAVYPRTGAESAVRIPAQSDRSVRALDRDERWIEVNTRVLAFAADTRTPLIERLRFLAIFSDHLDQLFMAGADRVQRHIVHELVARRDAVLDEIQAALAAQGIRILRWDQASRSKQAKLGKLFVDRIGPVLTPLAVDPAHPFPRVSGLSLNLAVLLRDLDVGSTRFACVEIPPLMPRFTSVGDLRFVRLEEIVSAHLPELFPGLEVVESRCFRVTRSDPAEQADVDSADLVIDLEQQLIRRRFGPPVRLEIDDTVSTDLLDQLVHQLGVTTDAIYYVHNPLAMGAGLWTIPSGFPQP